MLLILSLFFVTAHADDRGAGVYPVADPDIGEMKIEVKDTGHTWLRLNVTYKCYDKRQRPNGAVPPAEYLKINRLTDVIICLYRHRPEALYDNVNKIMNVRYSRMHFSDSGGPNQCAIHDNAIVDLRRLCHAWQPPN